MEKTKVVAPKEDLEACAQIFKALGHPSRLKIVEKLIDGEKCVLEIRELIVGSQPNISQHLNILKYSGIVDYRRDGKLRCYYLCEPDRIKSIIGCMD